MRILSAIAIQANDTVGPTRLEMLTAGSAKLPVVVVEQADTGVSYHVFDVASLQVGLTNQLSATSIADALMLGDHQSVPAVTKSDASAAPVGSPVVDNGRLIGVTAGDEPEHPEPTEQDLAKANANFSESAAEEQPGSRKRGLWQRLKGS